MESLDRRARVFPARLGRLPDVAAFIVEVCGAAGFDRESGLKLTLLVEELFINTVVHGHRRESDEPVRLAFEVGPRRIALTYEDTAPPHDPFATVMEPDEAAALEDRRVGGLGVLLVAAMASDLTYRHAEGRNRISFVVSASHGGASTPPP